MFQRMVPPKFSTHEDCREAVCCCCGVKTDKKRISVREEALVVEFAKKEYDSKVQSYPAGLCLNCRRGKILVGSVSSHGSLRSHRSHGSLRSHRSHGSLRSQRSHGSHRCIMGLPIQQVFWVS